MTDRIVFGTVLKADGSPWVNGVIEFELRFNSYTSSAQYAKNRIQVALDANGEFSQELWCNSEGLTGAVYRCFLPSGEFFDFNLPVGTTPINLSQARSVGGSAPPTSPDDWIVIVADVLQYTGTFTQADLVGSLLTVPHGLNTLIPEVLIVDNTGDPVVPSNVRAIDANSVEIDFENGTPLIGTWSYRIR